MKKTEPKATGVSNKSQDNNKNSNNDDDKTPSPPSLKKQNDISREIRKGTQPKEVSRFDRGDPSHGEKPHIHLRDKRALNYDGTWKHGQGSVSNKLAEWLDKHGWVAPK